MRLQLGTQVCCTDEDFGELADIVIDPIERTVTHLVVQPHRQHHLARLVPITLASAGDDGGRRSGSAAAPRTSASSRPSTSSRS